MSPDGRPYRIRSLQPEDAERWDAFVEAAPDGTFYHLSGWKRIFEERLRHRSWYLYCESGTQILAVLPVVQVKSLLFGNALMSLPFLVYGGPVSAVPKAADMLIDKVVDLGRELQVDYLEFRNRALPPATRADSEWSGNCSYVTFRKRISPDPEENLLAIPRKQRAMIRKGIKAGLEAEVDTSTERLYRTLLECKRNLGTPFFGPAYLQGIKDTFGDRVEVTTVTLDGKTVCSVMSFLFGKEILPYYGGGGEAARHVKGNDFMYWKVMENACKDGVEIFDYGRSRAGTGSYRFKKHWGFEAESLHYRYLPIEADTIPELNPSNPKC